MKKTVAIVVCLLVAAAVYAGVIKTTDATLSRTYTFINSDTSTAVLQPVPLRDDTRQVNLYDGLSYSFTLTDLVSSGAGEAAVDTQRVRLYAIKGAEKILVASDSGLPSAAGTVITRNILPTDTSKSKYLKTYDLFQWEVIVTDTAGSGTNDTNVVTLSGFVRFWKEQ